MRNLILAAVAFLMIAPAQATTVSGVELEPQIQVQQQDLVLNGAGVRSKFFIDLYVGSLYLPAKSQAVDAILASEEVSAIRLNITSGMITSEKMTDAILEGFDNATNGNPGEMQQRIDDFIGVFNEEIVKGDQYTFNFIPGKGVVGFKNGEQKVIVDGDDFRVAMMKIWLGEKPAQKKLKQQMLGN
ncbi:chalcone isomerase family protein [Paraferrimonas sedimenticola]|uniref:Chalcone isomerase n=1 Tax=Paraferrimonas sedimenticola TaxID=375674 RepID=A0AA37W113_9GAMM|nr:chalcone isomerase family protein [Paraferrimonas sedimenticola]GLP98109.1 chalcone isomerase [Paraferrimonas sedimenticola]